MPGELPPPSPRIFFGRDELIETVVHLAEALTPIALIGAGGIGKTSVVLTVLHNNRIKQRFGRDRRFIRCDEFPATRGHFLRQLSKAIGAGVENPENLASLREFLSSKDILVVLDNAESILDSQGSDAREIYAIVDELTQFNNICVCITSRVSFIPPHCETIKVPTLTTAAARDTFYRIYKQGERSNEINDILERLDFHPLSITLLATVAQQNQWEVNRLTVEWEKRRTGVLHIQHSRSLATTIELSLASPTFQELGPDARSLLEVVAFFPQGVNEKNIDWLFPTISNVPDMFDKFCVLSLTYRNNGFITMLAPLRDHLCPGDPASSPLLCSTKERYIARLSGDILPGMPGFEEAQWITTEDVNVEHLLDVFTSADADSKNIWDACSNFMAQLYWHKSRLVALGPKVEALPDDHPSKVRCLANLSRLFESVGNFVERKRLLTRALKLCREQGDLPQVARTLASLCDLNRRIGLYKEGISQAKEASEIYEQLGDVEGQVSNSINLGWLLCGDKQLDAAEESVLRAIDLIPEKGDQIWIHEAHCALGEVYRVKGETAKAIHHLEMALEIAPSLSRVDNQVWVHFRMAEVFLGESKFGDAQTHIGRAKSFVVNNPYLLARASQLQARLWFAQDMLGEAKSEALCALNAFEKLGAVDDAVFVRWVLDQINARLPGVGQPGRS